MKLAVSARASRPADNYFKSQVALCILWTTLSIIMCIIGLMMHQKVKDVMASATAGIDQENIPAQYKNIQSYADHFWIYGLAELLCAMCLGTGFVFLAKYLLETGNAQCMKVCCVCDGIWGTISCFDGIALFILWILMMVWWSAMSDTAKICANLQMPLNTASTAAPSAVGTASIPLDCEKFIVGLKPVVGMFALMMCCLCTCAFKIAAILCFGAKNANEVSQIFEEEEFAEEAGAPFGYDVY